MLARDHHEHGAFRFLGQEKRVKTYGLSVSLIDFTLSRLNTGSLFVNLEHSDENHLIELSR